MALDQFLKDLNELHDQATAAFAAADNADALESARVEFLGAKSGRFKTVQKAMGGVDKADKRTAGQTLNAVKKAIQSAFEQAEAKIKGEADGDQADPQFDPTLPGEYQPLGRLHPITQTIEELKDIMGRLGFTPAEGPEIEDEFHNFEALNIPLAHPARDPLDNFYLEVANQVQGGALMLRSQTSTVQIRVMENTKPPIRIISLGRVYRPDTPDATHYPMFHQMEGLLIDTRVTMADLKSVLRIFASNYLGQDVRIRFRPSFFPFTEPSVECDFLWNDSWIEFGGAGMVDPNVLRAVGYDPDEVSGFAFGLGVERLCMRRHNLTDIRDLYENDVRFLAQF